MLKNFTQTAVIITSVDRPDKVLFFHLVPELYFVLEIFAILLIYITSSYSFFTMSRHIIKRLNKASIMEIARNL